MEVYQAITIFLAINSEKLSQTKWNKLMFFVDGAYFTEKGKTATNFNYIKMPYGPVPDNYRMYISSMAFDELINVGSDDNISDSVRIIKPPRRRNLIKKANEIISEDKKLDTIVEKVSDTFGHWTATRLSDFSHLMDAWKETEMYSEIDLNLLKKDKFLRNQFGISNFGKLVLNQ